MKKSVKTLIIILIAFQIGIMFFFSSLFFFHDLLDLTSSNSAIYVVKEGDGIKLRRDLMAGEREKLLFMFNANPIFDFFMKKFALAAGRSLLELTWDGEGGTGVIKQFRSDGRIFSVSLSRFEELGKPRGLFIGGDLPYGDADRDPGAATSGIGFYDGKQWYHLWCVSNEAFSLSGSEQMAAPAHWRYLGGRKQKDTYDEVVLESDHDIVIGDVRVLMKRTIRFRAGDDYLILKVRIINPNAGGIAYSYLFGDEPWIGRFGSSAGDVGWDEEGIIEAEAFIDPVRNKYAGFYDYGNIWAGESHSFSGYANFVKWISPTPSFVTFSNGKQCCTTDRPLDSTFNRMLVIAWKDQRLLPGESLTYTMALGMAKIGKDGLPAVPDI